MTFDLERARGLRDFLQDDCAEVGDVWGEMIAEIERLRAENEEAQESLTAAYMLGSHEKAHEQAAHISELEVEIAELKADLEQSEICIQARLDVIDQQAARIKSLKKEIRRLKHESKVEQEFTNSYIKRLHDAEARIKELEAQCEDLMQNCNSLRERAWKAEVRIKEQDDALVEGLTNFLHYRASCYDPARRCPYAKECDDCSTWDACGHVEKFRSEARQQLQAEGKIGPDAAKPQVWQITEERKAAIWHAIKVLKENDIMEEPEEHLWDEEVTVLQAMLREAGQ